MWTKIRQIFAKNKPQHLGRWCHKEIPGCNEKVIERKANLAIADNCYTTQYKNALLVESASKGLDCHFTTDLVYQYIMLNGNYKH